jgi:hypothetical protein
MNRIADWSLQSIWDDQSGAVICKFSPLRRYRLDRGWGDSKVQPVRHHSRGRLCSLVGGMCSAVALTVVMMAVMMAVLQLVDL